MKVQILDEAQQDLVDGYRFYEGQVAGLGDYFLDSLLSKRFPFAVYYRVENAIVRVYAVLDCRRDPSWIRDRLT